MRVRYAEEAESTMAEDLRGITVACPEGGLSASAGGIAIP
jgi:hypothetical protein